MAVHGILFLALFPGMCVAQYKGNLALKAEAVQSSTLDFRGQAKNAVDGWRDSDYVYRSCSHTDSDFNAWWRVDLNQVYGVNRVVITNRGDAVSERINGAQIRIGNSLDNNGNNNQLAATVDSIPAGETKTFKFNSIKGRYVNIVIPDRKEYLTLCEVEVYADDLTPAYTYPPSNLAYGAEAVQSSTFYEYAGDARKAVDGRKNTHFSDGSCIRTSSEFKPWWRADLNGVCNITRVVITNADDCCEWSIDGAQIRIGNSLDNNGNNNQLAATVDSIELGETKTFQFNSIEGRYVNIVIPYYGSLSLCEVEVFAD